MKTARIFISYANEDEEKALWLHTQLKRSGCEPWIDKRNIMAGELWERAIYRAIKASDIVIVLLSKSSIVKRGYVQKEFKMALRLWEEKLEDDIYLVPLRLDECRPPDALSKFQWVNLWEYDGYSRLLFAINTAMEKKLKDELAISEMKRGVETIKLFEEKELPTRYYASIEFPRFQDPNNIPGIERANAIIAKCSSDLFEKFIGDEKVVTSEIPAIEGDAGKSIIDASWTMTLWTGSVLSLRQDIYWYGAGAAHGNQNFVHFNFCLNPFAELKMADIFNIHNDWRKFLQDWCIHDLSKQLVEEGWDVDDGRLKWIESGVKDIETVGLNVTEDSIVLQWPPYEVGPYAWGPRRVIIPYRALKTITRNEAPLPDLSE